MYREISHTELSREILNQLSQGAFLTVKSKDNINVMTISCGTLGFTWMKPTFTVMVRQSRYTYKLIDSAKNFTVSFPLKGQLKNELNICGTTSGRNINKIKGCNFTLKKGILSDTLILDKCDLYLECRIIYKHRVDKYKLDDEIRNNVYSNGDYHVLYFGEIIKAYSENAMDLNNVLYTE